MSRWTLALTLLAAVAACNFDGVSGEADAGSGGLGPADVVDVLASCRAYSEAGFTESGVYPLDSNLSEYQAHCEMDAHGGGFTLALKIDGNQDTFLYDAEQPGALGGIWTSSATFNAASADLDPIEAKLRSFALVSVAQILIRFDGPLGDDIVLQLDVPAASLQELFTSPTPSALQTVEGDWRALVDPALVVLQENCSRVAVNQANMLYHRIRLGFDTNNEDDCNTNDSGVGVGLFTEVFDGPAAGAQNALVQTSMPVFAWVFVR